MKRERKREVDDPHHCFFSTSIGCFPFSFRAHHTDHSRRMYEHHLVGNGQVTLLGHLLLGYLVQKCGSQLEIGVQISI
jgi:hypothetical protein